MKRKPKDTTGHRWAIFRRQDIVDLLDTSDFYLTRWRLLQTPWFGVYLHAIHRSDGERHLHDHPWSFATLILRGGYDEEFASHLKWAQFSSPARRVWRAGSIHRIRRGQFHSIRHLHRTPTWTLLLVGPRRGEWGYATPGGLVPHDEYHAARRSTEASR